MDQVYISWQVTADGSFTSGIEGPACDAAGNLYAVNFAHQGTIGIVRPDGAADVFVELPEGSIGNGIRFDRAGAMYIADYTGHNILRVDMATREITVHAHDDRLNQPNDLAIDRDDTLYASDPNWKAGTGQLWQIRDGRFVLIEADMGTTNGIEVDMSRRLLYVNETVQRRVWVYDLAADGTPTNKRLFHEFPDFGMDGMRLDVAGNLYITRHGKGTVAILSPEGDVIREVELAGKHCTNIAFGGADGRTCYVTLADLGRVDAFRSEIPGQSWQLQQEVAAG